MTPLDHPVWTALTSDQQALGIGGPLARRYHPDVSPFVAVEVSAVCVDPDFRGRGYATLMTRLARSMQAAGETPFLHVLRENSSAIALYEKLGFKTRGSFFVTVFRHAA